MPIENYSNFQEKLQLVLAKIDALEATLAPLNLEYENLMSALDRDPTNVQLEEEVESLHTKVVTLEAERDSLATEASRLEMRDQDTSEMLKDFKGPAN